jgi:1-acyl-sn-glycerol-3-phosphate acyltransferase
MGAGKSERVHEVHKGEERWTDRVKDVIYRLGVPVLTLFLKLLFRLEVVGRENVPRGRGGLLVARHRSYWDIPLLLAALGPRNRIFFLARHTLLKNPFFYPFVRYFAIPINRENFGLDDFRKVVRAIQSDKIVGIFPEGTTLPTAEVRVGAVRFAERSGKPFLPARIDAQGPYPPKYPFRWPKVRVWIGKPFTLQELEREVLTGTESRAERYEKLAQALMVRIDQAGLDEASEHVRTSSRS